jgi:choice-of-anchor A domain-containing protein
VEYKKKAKAMNTTIQNIKHSAKRCGCLTATVAGLSLALAPSIFASVVPLGSAANYAVVGVGGSVTIQSDFEIYQSATVINGNVAEGPYTTLTHGIDATVNGQWDYDTTDANPSTIKPYTGLVTGGFHQLNLAGVAADARAASAAAAGYTPNQTFTTEQFEALDGSASGVVGVHGLNVIEITGAVTLKKTLTISGFADSSFIFQFTAPNSGGTTDGHDVLTFSGMNMILLGGVLADNLVWNLNGLGGGVDIQAMADNQTVYGTFLAPDRDILSDHGIIDGQLIGGGNGNEVSIHSSSQITLPGFIPPAPVPVPEPTTFIAGALLLLPFGASTLRILRRKATA